MKHLPIVFALALLAGLICSCANNADAPSSTAAASAAAAKGQSAVQDELSQPNILQVALGSKDHTTLVAGVQAAGLEDVLVNAGPLTVFAPTNAAFEKLPAGTLETLLKPENKATLARIIKFHAAPGSFSEEALKDGQNLYQASGHYIKVQKDGDKTTVHGANILGTVKASNGIVHVVDTVMLPPEN
jgi:uncharacterized surface protein with fasciclin (FAS1) repeats